MKSIFTLNSLIFLSACNTCEKCEVLKDGQTIEKYESCDEEGMKVTKEICQGSAKMQAAECKCNNQ